MRSARQGRIIVLAAVLMLAGCGGGGGGTVAPPEDQVLARNQRLARLSFEQQRPEQAAVLYRQALDRARERDDLQAIADLGYDLAVAQLRSGDAPGALTTAQATRAELTRRGVSPEPELLLVEAAALYRSGDGSGAAQSAAQIIAMPDVAGETRARAAFIRGLAAADAADLAALSVALEQVGDDTDGPLAADRQELNGRLALLRGDPAAARTALLEAADRRRVALDYQGMARALAMAGAAARTAGDSAEAADLYLRAGRSAQLQQNRLDARIWLSSARDLGRSIGARGITDEATLRLADLGVVPGR